MVVVFTLNFRIYLIAQAKTDLGIKPAPFRRETESVYSDVLCGMAKKGGKMRRGILKR